MSAHNQPSPTAVCTLAIPPGEADPTITDWREPHIAVLGPQRAAIPRLLVYLTGSFGIPRPQTAFVLHAARLGLHTINLRYPNRWTVGGRCRHSRDPEAHAKFRATIITGERQSGLVRMPSQDAIVTRLARLLLWLAQHHPAEGWDTFLSSGQPRWESILIAGHSQGGGHAAMMSKLFPLARAIMLAAPADHLHRLEMPAPWIARSGATPPAHLFGFVHARDPNATHILMAWELMGLNGVGPVVNVDAEPLPFRHTHQLVTLAAVRAAHRSGVWPPWRSNRYHASVASARATAPLADGTPRFADAWRQILVG